MQLFTLSNALVVGYGFDVISTKGTTEIILVTYYINVIWNNAIFWTTSK